MEYNRNNPLRVVTLCSGYDSQCLALNRLKRDFPEFDYELVAWSEWDPDNPHRPIPQWQKDMAQWCNKKQYFSLFPFEEFSPRKGFRCDNYLRG